MTNWLSPSGFSCQKTTRASANDTLSCTGTLLARVTISGNIRMSPGPAVGMGAELFVILDGYEQGPFDLSGP